jgi:hypothetical protein
VIQTWHDRRIPAGGEIDARISENLENAQIILLLVSAYFLASDYCYDIEMTRAQLWSHDGMDNSHDNRLSVVRRHCCHRRLRDLS